MPRVHTQKAGKDYPAHNIKKGDTYYWWKFRYGGKVMSKTHPRPSQLTQSKMSGALAAGEQIEDAIRNSASPSDLAEAMREAAGSIREVADEYREAKENMPENLQDSPTAQECEEKADNLEAWADDIEAAADEVDDVEGADEFDDYGETKQGEIMDEAREIAGNVSDCPL